MELEKGESWRNSGDVGESLVIRIGHSIALELAKLYRLPSFSSQQLIHRLSLEAFITRRVIHA